MTEQESNGVQQIETGIKGFDTISRGGLPAGRTTLLSGTAGSGKTIFGSQFLASGIQSYDQNGIFVTFEETPEDIRNNLHSFGWPIQQWEDEEKWTFIDVSPDVTQEQVTGEFDLSALVVRIKSAAERTNAKRITIDSLSGIYNLFVDKDRVRQELYRIIQSVNDLGLTTVLTAERLEEEGSLSRYGVEQFVSDNVVLLRNELDNEIRRRSIEILKFRGCDHNKGEYPYAIVENQGIEVVGTQSRQLGTGASTKRLGTGIQELDAMTNGGYFQNSLVLVTGGTGTGKTLTSNHFVKDGYDNGERVILFHNEESTDQLIRNARGCGIPLQEMCDSELLRIHYHDPRETSLEERMVQFKKEINEFQPDRIVIDSLSALKRHVSERSYSEFVLGLCSFLKNSDVTALMTSTGPVTDVGESLSHANISTSVDTIIMLRYAELFGTIQRGIIILKMRGTDHEHYIRKFTIDDAGIHIQEPFTNISGVLSGSLSYATGDEVKEISQAARNRSDDLNDEE